MSCSWFSTNNSLRFSWLFFARAWATSGNFICLNNMRYSLFSSFFLSHLFFLLPTLWRASLARLIMLKGISERTFYQQTWRNNFFSILTRGFGRINWKIRDMLIYIFSLLLVFTTLFYLWFLHFVPNLIYQLYYDFFRLS